MIRITRKSRNVCSKITARTSAVIARGCSLPAPTFPRDTANMAISSKQAAGSVRPWGSQNCIDPHSPRTAPSAAVRRTVLRYDLPPDRGVHARDAAFPRQPQQTQLPEHPTEARAGIWPAVSGLLVEAVGVVP